MRIRASLSVIVLACLAGDAAADPRLHLSWDSCTNPVATRSLVPGETSVTVSVTASGWDVEHRGFRVVFLVRGDAPFDGDCQATFPPVPDAWRFVTSGCAGRPAAQFTFTGGPAACPSLVDGSPGTSTSVTTDALPLPSSTIDAVRLVASALYPLRAPADPSQRYELVRMRFDLTSGLPGAGGEPAACAGIEQSVALTRTYPIGPVGGPCIRTDVHSSWTDAGGNLQLLPWDSVENLRFEGAIVPAVARTWGQIKGQYR